MALVQPFIVRRDMMCPGPQPITTARPLALGEPRLLPMPEQLRLIALARAHLQDTYVFLHYAGIEFEPETLECDFLSGILREWDLYAPIPGWRPLHVPMALPLPPPRCSDWRWLRHDGDWSSAPAAEQ